MFHVITSWALHKMFWNSFSIHWPSSLQCDDYWVWFELLLRNCSIYTCRVIVGVIWAIWTSRNKHVMENKPQLAQEIKLRIHSFLKEFDELGKRLPAKFSPFTEKWSPPTDPYVKVNVGAAFKEHRRQSRSDFVIRDMDGQVVGSGMVINPHIPDAFLVEALACV
ncbi:hypothetical protein ES319_D11G181800v1 [Gossypium barbadense]|uniref:RNase H type-1 domain-containing protein n=1 Tax=Gossypium barbadense TaxID=3634 RepID=A0A5J5PC89_GOSBA|nr:hypothetical protein ES319_D11G181800v1 [Gossypium barbadense]